MKKVAIIQSNYIPWEGYFDLIASEDEFILYDGMQYTKRDWRNRNKMSLMRSCYEYFVLILFSYSKLSVYLTCFRTIVRTKEYNLNRFYVGIMLLCFLCGIFLNGSAFRIW
ncbi:WbqC family protein [Vibrio tubiashii]|uniref:WbqC-like family protein n=1 Tax=Vibrio tubiashii ATCC 19109 TaxID=1051646 RepID=F9T0G2_9VIBR|nr:WbqC family protein [Vibrio tubiashii]AIW12747.1 hypothetical protein IX91_00680 [Vibrio tubiashii ATCC 19109]EGU58722.1 WbqC-like family protein [Vibrio tubiashii ATCC 19109]EIF03095.1 WbqC-like family protein [Vibrio tubiashii NCIMB 1337 = ATCC 19106]